MEGEEKVLRDDPTSRNKTRELVRLESVYQDEDVLVIEKPFDVPMGADFKFSVHSLIERDYKEMLTSITNKRERKIHYVHMLDYETSGLLCIAFTKKAASSFGAAFSRHQTAKLYVAMVEGLLDLNQVAFLDGVTWNQELDANGEPIRRSVTVRNYVVAQGFDGAPPVRQQMKSAAKSPDEKEMISVIAPLCYGKYKQADVTLVAMRLFTGRRHQLRLHCKHLGHPIVGDTVYSEYYAIDNSIEMNSHLPQFDSTPDRMMLHAQYLRIQFPKSTGQIARDEIKYWESAKGLSSFVSLMSGEEKTLQSYEDVKEHLLNMKAPVVK